MIRSFSKTPVARDLTFTMSRFVICIARISWKIDDRELNDLDFISAHPYLFVSLEERVWLDVYTTFQKTLEYTHARVMCDNQYKDISKILENMVSRGLINRKNGKINITKLGISLAKKLVESDADYFSSYDTVLEKLLKRLPRDMKDRIKKENDLIDTVQDFARSGFITPAKNVAIDIRSKKTIISTDTRR